MDKTATIKQFPIEKRVDFLELKLPLISRQVNDNSQILLQNQKDIKQILEIAQAIKNVLSVV
jgi:hypothetical protein